MRFCTFSAFAQKIFKGWVWNLTWSFGKVICSKSMKMMFMASIIRYKLCMIYAFLYFFVQRSFLTKNYFLIAAINLTTRGQLYTCFYWNDQAESLLFHSNGRKHQMSKVCGRSYNRGSDNGWCTHYIGSIQCFHLKSTSLYFYWNDCSTLYNCVLNHRYQGSLRSFL